jgi:hypothetical protein
MYSHFALLFRISYKQALSYKIHHTAIKPRCAPSTGRECHMRLVVQFAGDPGVDSLVNMLKYSVVWVRSTYHGNRSEHGCLSRKGIQAGPPCPRGLALSLHGKAHGVSGASVGRDREKHAPAARVRCIPRPSYTKSYRLSTTKASSIETPIELARVSEAASMRGFVVAAWRVSCSGGPCCSSPCCICTGLPQSCNKRQRKDGRRGRGELYGSLLYHMQSG